MSIRLKRLVFAPVLALVLLALPAPASGLLGGDTAVSITCTDGYSLQVVVDADTLLGLTAAVQAINDDPIGSTCLLAQTALAQTSVALFSQPALADDKKDFVVGAGEAFTCLHFKVKADSDAVNTPATVKGKLEMRIAEEDFTPACAGGSGFTGPGSMKADVVCLSISGNVAHVFANVEKSEGSMSFTAVEAYFEDNAPDKINYSVRNVPFVAGVNCVPSLFAGFPIDKGKIKVHDAAPSIKSGVVVITPQKMDGWAEDSSGTANVQFVVGPGVPPLGQGSAQFSVGTDGNSGAQLRNNLYTGTPLSSLTALSYSTYDQTAANCNVLAPFGGEQAVYIILNIDWDNNGTTDDLIFFEPTYQGPFNCGAWYTWNALTGNWWSANDGAFPPPGAPFTAYEAAHSSARIVNSSTGKGGVRLVAGFGAPDWNNFIGNTDAFTIGVSGNTTTYDFEP